MKLWDELKKQMLRHPEQTVCEGGAEITYAQLVEWAEQFAEHLRGLNCCAILLNSELAAAAALLSCFAAGVTAVPLSKRYGEVHCNKILKKISPDAVITDEEGTYRVRRDPSAAYVAPERHPALIMCTSGTTGDPKGAMLSEDNILTNVSDIAYYFAIGQEDSILIARPLYHCAVLTGEFLTALIKGCRIRFYSERFNPAVMPELIGRYGITAFCGTPTLLGLMARFDRVGKAGSLKHICISGECMDRETGLRIANAYPGARIYHVYGLTEACPRVSWMPPDRFREFPDCVGIPLRSVSVKLLREDGTEAEAGEEGMLWIKGGNVMTGYYRDPAATAKVLHDGWLCTGDLAVLLPEGFLKIRGRRDGLIIKAGMNIYPQEIEAALKADPRVREVLAYGYKTGAGQVQIGLRLAGDLASEDEVRELCAKCLPPYQMPQNIEILNEVPKNGSGKIKRGEYNVGI